MGRWLLASVLTWQKVGGGYSLRREPGESLSLNRGGACLLHLITGHGVDHGRLDTKA
jgi:hypothetical protein